jgi:excisionase family DNA binding protein
MQGVKMNRSNLPTLHSVATPVLGDRRERAALAACKKLFPTDTQMSVEGLIMDEILALQNKRLLRVDEAARLLSVSRWTVYRWVEAGRLGGTRIGAGSLRIFSDTVAALINQHCVGIPVVSEMAQRTHILQESSRPIGRRSSGTDLARPRQQATL